MRKYARNEPGSTKAGRQKKKPLGKEENLMFASLQKRGDDAMQDARRRCTRPQGETTPRMKTTHGPGFSLLDPALPQSRWHHSPLFPASRCHLQAGEWRRWGRVAGASGYPARRTPAAGTRSTLSLLALCVSGSPLLTPLICIPRNPSHVRRTNPRILRGNACPPLHFHLAPILHTQAYPSRHLSPVP